MPQEIDGTLIEVFSNLKPVSKRFKNAISKSCVDLQNNRVLVRTGGAGGKGAGAPFNLVFK